MMDVIRPRYRREHSITCTTTFVPGLETREGAHRRRPYVRSIVIMKETGDNLVWQL